VHFIVLLIAFHLNLIFKFKFKCIWIAFKFPLFFLFGPAHFPFFLLLFLSSPYGPAYGLSLPFSPFPPASGPPAVRPIPLARVRPLPLSFARTDRRCPPVRPFVLPLHRTRTRTRVRLAPSPALSPLQSASGPHANAPRGPPISITCALGFFPSSCSPKP
jgi:hypothetical protein